MNLDQDFQNAQARVQNLPQKPDPQELLQLYSLFKQATVGDAQGKKPGMLDFIGKAKYEAWEARKGQSGEEAKKEYIKVVEELEGKYK